MAKFLDKKEQVIDFQLTPYGKQRLSVGKLNPEYYAFFDDGVMYDSRYAGIYEDQNNINLRIKEETQYLEGIIRFEEIETTPPPPIFLSATPEEEAILRSDIDISPSKNVLNPNKYSFGTAIGSAKFEGENTQAAPAWKIVTCQGEISSVTTIDDAKYNFTSASSDAEATEYNIPQINITSTYTKVASSPLSYIDRETIGEIISETNPFSDGNVIRLVRNDIVVYAEEQNTALLTENFDIEVFEMSDTTVDGATITSLNKKYFEKEVEQIVDGIMKFSTPQENMKAQLNSEAVEYYFDILTDKQISDKIGCQCASSFSRDSYYIDLDYECEDKGVEQVYYDIYGTATVPEICEPPEISDEEPCEDDE
tara:strand:+ start:1458 stop:2558 length:1101 start_codon:yes stop_codon:yes gene_type:complete